MTPKESDLEYQSAFKERVHQWRSQEQSIMIGVQTALNDKIKLLVEGKTAANSN